MQVDFIMGKRLYPIRTPQEIDALLKKWEQKKHRMSETTFARRNNLSKYFFRKSKGR